MYAIVGSNTYNRDGGTITRECAIKADTLTDLPGEDDIKLYNIGFGSVAYVIDTGDFYVLNSEGVWT